MFEYFMMSAVSKQLCTISCLCPMFVILALLSPIPCQSLIQIVPRSFRLNGKSGGRKGGRGRHLEKPTLSKIAIISLETGERERGRGVLGEPVIFFHL